VRTYSYPLPTPPTINSLGGFACFRSQIATEGERCFFGLRFSDALLSSLADFATVTKNSRMHLFSNCTTLILFLLRGIVLDTSLVIYALTAKGALLSANPQNGTTVN